MLKTQINVIYNIKINKNYSKGIKFSKALIAFPENVQ
jgi:hypothetical protein